MKTGIALGAAKDCESMYSMFIYNAGGMLVAVSTDRMYEKLELSSLVSFLYGLFPTSVLLRKPQQPLLTTLVHVMHSGLKIYMNRAV